MTSPSPPLTVSHLSSSQTASTTFCDVVLASLLTFSRAESEVVYIHRLMRLFEVCGNELSVTTCQYEVEGVAVELHDIRCAGKRSKEDDTLRRIIRKWSESTNGSSSPLSSALRRGMCVGTLRSCATQDTRLVVLTGLPKAFDRSLGAICMSKTTTSGNATEMDEPFRVILSQKLNGEFTMLSTLTGPDSGRTWAVFGSKNVRAALPICTPNNSALLHTQQVASCLDSMVAQHPRFTVLPTMCRLWLMLFRTDVDGVGDQCQRVNSDQQGRSNGQRGTTHQTTTGSDQQGLTNTQATRAATEQQVLSNDQQLEPNADSTINGNDAATQRGDVVRIQALHGITLLGEQVGVTERIVPHPQGHTPGITVFGIGRCNGSFHMFPGNGSVFKSVIGRSDLSVLDSLPLARTQTFVVQGNSLRKKQSKDTTQHTGQTLSEVNAMPAMHSSLTDSFDVHNALDSADSAQAVSTTTDVLLGSVLAHQQHQHGQEQQQQKLAEEGYAVVPPISSAERQRDEVIMLQNRLMQVRDGDMDVEGEGVVAYVCDSDGRLVDVGKFKNNEYRHWRYLRSIIETSIHATLKQQKQRNQPKSCLGDLTAKLDAQLFSALATNQPSSARSNVKALPLWFVRIHHAMPFMLEYLDAHRVLWHRFHEHFHSVRKHALMQVERYYATSTSASSVFSHINNSYSGDGCGKISVKNGNGAIAFKHPCSVEGQPVSVAATQSEPLSIHMPDEKHHNHCPVKIDAEMKNENGGATNSVTGLSPFIRRVKSVVEQWQHQPDVMRCVALLRPTYDLVSDIVNALDNNNALQSSLSNDNTNSSVIAAAIAGPSEITGQQILSQVRNALKIKSPLATSSTVKSNSTDALVETVQHALETCRKSLKTKTNGESPKESNSQLRRTPKPQTISARKSNTPNDSIETGVLLIDDRMDGKAAEQIDDIFTGENVELLLVVPTPMSMVHSGAQRRKRRGCVTKRKMSGLSRLGAVLLLHRLACLLGTDNHTQQTGVAGIGGCCDEPTPQQVEKHCGGEDLGASSNVANRHQTSMSCDEILDNNNNIVDVDIDALAVELLYTGPAMGVVNKRAHAKNKDSSSSQTNAQRFLSLPMFATDAHAIANSATWLDDLVKHIELLRTDGMDAAVRVINSISSSSSSSSAAFSRVGLERTQGEVISPQAHKRAKLNEKGTDLMMLYEIIDTDIDPFLLADSHGVDVLLVYMLPDLQLRKMMLDQLPTCQQQQQHPQQEGSFSTWQTTDCHMTIAHKPDAAQRNMIRTKCVGGGLGSVSFSYLVVVCVVGAKHAHLAYLSPGKWHNRQHDEMNNPAYVLATQLNGWPHITLASSDWTIMPAKTSRLVERWLSESSEIAEGSNGSFNGPIVGVHQAKEGVDLGVNVEAGVNVEVSVTVLDTPVCFEGDLKMRYSCQRRRPI